MTQNMPFFTQPAFKLNQMPTTQEYISGLGKHFLTCHGYNLFGQFVNAHWKDRKDIIIDTQLIDGENRTVSLRLCLAETMIMKESDIPGVQEQFAVVAASYGWKTAHIDYRIFHSNLCRLTNIWLYTNLEPKKETQCP